MISTFGRYALRIMGDLAQNTDAGFIKLKDIAKRQQLSHSYLANIMAKLSEAGLVETRRGTRIGGARLVKPPQDYTIAEILIAADETLAPMVCLLPDTEGCPRAEFCPTRRVWEGYAQVTFDYLNSKTLADIACVEDKNPPSLPRLCSTPPRSNN